MAIKVAINGTGRIGLCTSRIIGTREDIELVALNTTTDIDTLLHLIRYDSVHRGYDAQKIDENTLRIGNNKNVKILSDRDPSNLDFSKYGATGVIECTGKFNSLEKSSLHLKNNIQKVIISAPADNTPTFVYGVNHTHYKGEKIISNASCTTNCLAPIVKVLHDCFGIQNALMTTIHSYTNDQNILDVKHKDIRRARAAALNLIPTTTGAAKAIGLVIPELEGKLNGFAIRVPTPDVSLIDLSINVSLQVTKESINEAFLIAQENTMKGLILVDNDKCVSSDFIGSPYSAIFVPDKTLVLGDKSAKVLAWYDNEMGYSHRLVDMSVWVLNH
ncbi:type I glyceraldehyde-3-phosphate dehydrogenase [Helicobacter sp. 11S03491-1]|uniref:type I glyceraldehyde-3-phosphate dehydrogenase n=1 Tax=Helicobacter sp. 11S03491-1 TaxID=1476196 RepID=UPI000BA698DA|nr:type I glyceraldehyde-3-phosphate dehydrogenase [Helicobacter sp. 11S03491-1]PAF41710.1 type I glyceraldehyde-3-phosphate dehydrogenase [Helicobacter sp. 11S03491-1]